MNDFDVICLGDATIDIFLPLDRDNQNYKLNETEISFDLGDKFLADGYKLFLGGIASNVAVGLSRLGKKVALVTELGEDELSETILKKLKSENVSTELIKINGKAQTTLSVIIMSQKKHILFDAHNLKEHQFNLENSNSSWLFIAGLGEKWKETYESALNFTEAKNIKIAFAPGTNQVQEGKDKIAKVLDKTEIVFVNKTEAQIILEETGNIENLLKSFKSLGPKNVVITDGTNGSYALDSDSNFFHQEIVASETVETTGAGDAYAAAFFAAFISNKPIQECMRWGALNSSSVIEHIGAQEGLLTLEEMEKKLNG